MEAAPLSREPKRAAKNTISIDQLSHTVRNTASTSICTPERRLAPSHHAFPSWSFAQPSGPDAAAAPRPYSGVSGSTLVTRPVLMSNTKPCVPFLRSGRMSGVVRTHSRSLLTLASMLSCGQQNDRPSAGGRGNAVRTRSATRCPSGRWRRGGRPSRWP